MKDEGYNVQGEVKCVLNKDKRSYFSQWNRIRLHGNNVFRETMDENDTITLQYIVPVHLRESFLRKAHQCKFSGHLGRQKTLERLTTKCYWPGQTSEVEEFVRGCDSCQRIKPPIKYNRGELWPIQANKPFEMVTSDMMGPLPVTRFGNKHILIVCDHFTKWTELYALKTLQAKELAESLSKFICTHGVPDKILSDQGTNYQSELISEVLELMDIQRSKTTPYHPQCDGLSERFNRTMKAMLSSCVNKEGDDWFQWTCCTTIQVWTST